MDADTLVRAIRAALDERERIAQIVAARYVGPDGTRIWPLPTIRARFRNESDPAIAAGLTLIEMFGPAAVLRLVAALREIAGLHEFCADCGPGWAHRPGCHRCAQPWPCDEMAALARGLGINPEEETPQ